jgi:hypothetical protein
LLWPSSSQLLSSLSEQVHTINLVETKQKSSKSKPNMKFSLTLIAVVAAAFTSAYTFDELSRRHDGLMTRKELARSARKPTPFFWNVRWYRKC